MKKAGPMMTNLGTEANAALVDLAAQTVKFGNIGMSSFGKVAAVIGGDFVKGAEGWVASLKKGEAGGKDLGLMFKAMSDPKNMEGVARMALAGDEGAKSVMALMTGFKTMDKEMKTKLLATMGKTEEQFMADMAAAKKKAETENKGTNALLKMQDKMAIAFGKIQSTILNLFEPALVNIGNFAADDLIPAFEGLMAGLTPVIKAVGTVAGVIFKLIKAVSPDLMVVLGAAGAAFAAYTAVMWLASTAKKVHTALTMAASAGLTTLISPVLLLAAPFIAIGVAAWLLWKYWDKLPALFKKAWKGIEETFTAVGKWFGDLGGNLWSMIESGFSWLWEWSPINLIAKMFDIDIAGWIKDIFSFDFWPFNKNKGKDDDKKHQLQSVKDYADIDARRSAMHENMLRENNRTHEAKMAEQRREMEIRKLSIEKMQLSISNNPIVAGIRSIFGGSETSTAQPAAAAAVSTTQNQTNVIAASKDQTVVMGDILNAIKEQSEVAKEHVIQTKKLGRSRAVGMTETN